MPGTLDHYSQVILFGVVGCGCICVFAKDQTLNLIPFRTNYSSGWLEFGFLGVVGWLIDCICQSYDDMIM